MNSTPDAFDWEGATMASRAEFLKARIALALAYLERSRDRNRRRATTIKLSTVGLSAVATVLLGLQLSGMDDFLRNFAFILVTLVTLLNALEPFFNFRSMWVEEEASIAQFFRLRDELGYEIATASGGTPSDEVLDRLFHQFLQIWEHHNNAWLGFRKGEGETHQLLV
jgi:hypothetical protein